MTGKTTQGKTTQGKTASGKTASGKTAPGKTAPGKSAPGKTVSGESARSRVLLGAMTVAARIGVYGHERGRTQPLVVSVALDLAATRFAADDLSATVDYDRVAGHVRTLADTHVDLVEMFAERLAALCLAEPGVTAVTVRIDKPEAVAGAVAGVEIVRLRP